MTDRDLFDGVIDRDVAAENLRRFLESPDGLMREFLAVAVNDLACGHKRPTNLHETEALCPVGCGAQRVVEVTMLPEPQLFPHPDGLSDLPSPS